MKMSSLRHVLFISLLVCLAASDQSASFYGESYISVPLQDASSSTDLQLHFKTHRPNGLLLLAAGSTDNMVLEVKSGVLEVRVNLGSGEASVFSSPSIRLDDQQWHEVKVNRTSGLLELTVDGVLQGSVSTPGSFHELNVEDGIFLGGLGTYSSHQHAHLHSFRGCMQNVRYNKHDILPAAMSLKSVKNAMEITWDCDSEFSAGSDNPVSFLSETSFVAFPRFHVRERGAFACDFKTRSEMAVLLFNSGQGDFKDDFLSLEILDGQPKLSVNSGSGLVEVVLVDKVNDGKWHQLDLSVSQSTVELRIDNARNTTRFGGEQSHLNLAGHLFVGGLGLKARAHALRLGLTSLQGERAMKGSLVGCVRNIVINSREFGFRELQVSRHVDTVCSWTFPCASGPCVEDAECVEAGQQFRCICDQSVCEKSIANKDSNLPGVEDIHELIAVQPLEVQEGGHAVINTNTIDVIFDYRSYRIRETAVRFRVLIPPRFGRLEVDRGQRQAESFTLLDLHPSKVNYVHDGTDSQIDDITLELSISGGSEVPVKFKGNFEFVLPIKVISHHDPPILLLPSGNQINILENSKLQLTTLVVDVRDPDTRDEDLKYHVHFVRSAQSFFENYNSSGEAISSFSHQAILDGRVWFVHKEDAVVDVQVKISDDSSQEDSIVMRFLKVSLKIEVTQNTGLTVPYTTSVFLSTGNLSAVTNVPLQHLELRYRLTKLPNFGQIQRLQHGIEEWTDVDTFTQRHLNTTRIRYSHTSSDLSASGDEFSFIVSAKDVETVEQTLKVTFAVVTLNVKANNRLVINQVPYGRLENASLLVADAHAQIDNFKLTFTVYRVPKLGSVFVASENRIFNQLDFDFLQPLEAGANFSQGDVNQGRVYFKFSNTGFERLEDYMDLTVRYPSSSVDMLRVWVEYVPLKTAVHFTNNGLREVAEGGMKVISKTQLYLERDGYKDFQFTLIQPPRHGNISLMDPHSSTISVPWVKEFTSTDILEGKVLYKHDDSENDRDSFLFDAVPVFSSEELMPEEIQEFTGTFHISMTMRNDNPPERLVDKVFHIMRDGRKTLTLDDLAFTDKDINFNASELQYRRQTINNGEIHMADTGVPVYQFKQRDLEQGHLVFQHRGPEVGHTTLFVTDGQYIWTGQFQVQASNPYINITTNTGITVNSGGRAVISGRNLSYESNMDFTPSALSFIVTEEPLHGTIQVDAKETTEFTYSDILSFKVEYVHDGGKAEEDLFRFTVVGGDVQAQGSFPIMIDDVRMQQPPDVIRNQILKISEGETAKITRSHLLLQHPSLNEEELVFIITSPPKHGQLQLRGIQLYTDKPMQFSQLDIDRGTVEYVHTRSMVTDDQFVLDVDSDTKPLRNLVFSIEITPKSLPIEPSDLTVPEGGSIALTPQTLKPVGLQYVGEDLVYEVMQIPAHGHICNSVKTEPYNVGFTSRDITDGQILYQHDDSESRNDSFTVVASLADGSLKSQLVTVKVKIIPKDDQPPRVVINKGLNVWADSVTLITGTHLLADDPDTASGDIVFTVSPPTNGHLAFLNNTFNRILKFSQLDIDAGRVAFVHKGNTVGHFIFQTTDGTNSDIQHMFRVHASLVVLQMRKRGPLAVFPNTIHPLSNASLLATTNLANFTKPIVFTITNPRPSKGKLVTMVAGRPLEIKSFTQDEVNSGTIFYQHTEYMENWQQKDSIHFELSTAYAKPLTGQVADIDVSFANIQFENQEMLLGLYKVSVVEGSSVVITRTHFDSTELLQRFHAFRVDITMMFRVVIQPRHGDLYLDGKEMRQASTFTQEDVDRERLRYEHDDSDSHEDLFSFSVVLNSRSGETRGISSPKHAVNFTIEVMPVNDQEFTLITQNPEIRVLQGGEVTLGKETLLTTDPDTAADSIIYTILSDPSNGKLVRRSDINGKTENFTQQEINSGKLMFIQNGTRGNGNMYFKVTDGQFPALYKMLVISVIPVFIDMSRVKPVHLMQSKSSVYLSNQFLNVSTNGNKEALTYELIEAPQYGHILRAGIQVRQFSQADVDNNSILYVMHNYNYSEDMLRYEIQIEDSDVSLKDLTLRIIVKPLVKQAPLVVPAGATVAITKSNLDASELAERTQDDPTFQIISPPNHGMILRKLRKRRDLIAQPVLKPVQSFTFEDIVYAKIFYVSDASDSEGPPVMDSFSFILRAQNAQPAAGKFLINVDETEISEDRNTVNSSEIDVDVSQSQSDEENQTDDTVIVGIILGVLLAVAVIVIVVVVIWRRHRWEQERYKENLRQTNRPRPYISGPLQLEQPHVTIEPHGLPSPGDGEGEDEEERCLMRHSVHQGAMPVINITHDAHRDSPYRRPRTPDLSRMEISSAVPDCRVTPLLESKSSPPDKSGDMSGERRLSGRSSTSTDLYDWTLMDPELLQHCRTETPVLRENQYWV